MLLLSSGWLTFTRNTADALTTTSQSLFRYKNSSKKADGDAAGERSGRGVKFEPMQEKVLPPLVFVFGQF